MRTKYIFVTGGVVSGVGKGITTASLGRLLKARGYKVALQKFDPYLNVDPGTISPYQHGEVFVTDDGTETDLDLGHYERFTDVSLNCYSSLTTGKIYSAVIAKERNGDYLGETIQVIPHVTNEIKSSIHKAAEEGGADIVITEIGGTVGDIESLPCLEAIRQVAVDVGRENCMYIHVTMVPFLETSHELKSKPTQHSVKELLSLGIQPDCIVCRTKYVMPPEFKDKLALFCNVSADCVIDNVDVATIYDLPLMLEKKGFANVVAKRLGLTNQHDLSEWTAMVNKSKHANKTVRIALVGKYIALRDAYISVSESLTHAGIDLGAKIELHYISSEINSPEEEQQLISALKPMDAILVPGGFGDRGIDGKIAAIRYARENKIPFLGICLGLQLAVIEYAQNVIGLDGAYSTELMPNTSHPVIDLMQPQKHITGKGATMRLGAYPCILAKGTKAYEAYGETEISERHRHRCEFNIAYRDSMSDGNFTFSGMSPDNKLVEVIELADHPWFVGVQFHPEFKSRPNKPHPLFREFVKAALEKL